ncbi:MAG: methyltransferase domain-containing protein [Ruminococcaceae bacterium]|nr:methyltransferase domain-containing protein [Oscillospiraceae bacterium]
MTDWNSALYLQFTKQRTQPAIDLAARLSVSDPCRLLDIGCGPGNSTAVIMERFPQAQATGVDSSENMLAKARADHPSARFELCDVSCELSALGGDWDVIFSNACLQWVPDHGRILGELMSMLREGGELAVQMPVNHNEPIERVIAQTAESDRWRAHFSSDGVYHTLTAGEYYDILSAAASCVDIWQTTYYHVMPSHDAIMDWYRSTGLRPYLNVLSDEDKVQFEADVLAGLRREYPLQADGCVLFPFPRLFFIARK